MNLHATHIAAAAILTTVSPADANDEALYGAAVPEDAVFVRFLADHPAKDLTAFGWTFETDLEQVAYSVVSASLLPEAPASRFSTVVVTTEGEGIVIPEPDRTSASKVHLLLLNATVNAVSLVADGGAIEVIRPTRFGAANIRAVNPIKAEFSVVQVPSQTVLGTFDVSMSRGEDLSFIVTNDGVELVPTSYGAVITD